MPISSAFADRLLPSLDAIAREFGTPFHIYDEAGIVAGGQRLNELLGVVGGFREYYAVKALPNLSVLKILRSELGFGFDCSSIAELRMVRLLGAQAADIMFTSNNTSAEEYAEALGNGGCILNLDDVSFVDKPAVMPELICFRYNPGTVGIGNAVIGAPRAAKFGLRHDQLLEAYSRARARGAKRFGLHAMVVSNESQYGRVVTTVETLLAVCRELSAALGIEFEFVNMGGGLSIPYRPEDEPFDLVALARDAGAAFSRFERDSGYRPKLFMECGRFVTGPHGVLVTRVINVMSKYRDYVGVDASMSALMRPGMYESAYNHVTAHGSDGQEKRGPETFVDVVGSLCENNDKFAEQIALPPVAEGDYLVIHDTGAHGHSMGFQYNGRLRPQELLLRRDGAVERVRRAETVDDYLRTQLALEPHVLEPHVLEASREKAR